MFIGLIIILSLIAVIAIYAVLIYNRLVSLKHGTSKAWSNIDVLLKQRHDELPKLIETCKQYMRHERDTLEKVMQARAGVFRATQSGNIRELGGAETLLRQGLTSLFAVAEAYPDLKANDSFKRLESRITGLEESIADRREFYNESVNNNNIRIEQFPDVLIAQLFNFAALDLLEFSEEEKRDVDVKALFA
ncbi:MAG: LemA family protein [Methylococcaceae bacterium]|nr:LemA family protein [Methylococcaceae bacterium]MCI0733557.1 LemA family protein [Methylococcaceae bacterium]